MKHTLSFIFFLLVFMQVNMAQTPCAEPSVCAIETKLWQNWALPSSNWFSLADPTATSAGFNNTSTVFNNGTHAYYDFTRTQIEYYLTRASRAQCRFTTNKIIATTWSPGTLWSIDTDYLGAKAEYLQHIQKVEPRMVLTGVPGVYGSNLPQDYYTFSHFDIVADLVKGVHDIGAGTAGFKGRDIIVGAYFPEGVGNDAGTTFCQNGFSQYQIPAWVYPYFGETAPVTPEYYCADNMIYGVQDYPSTKDDDNMVDISKRMSKMWYFQRAALYIDRGIEMLNLGVLDYIDDNDPGHVHTYALITAIKKYAAKNARRKFVLITAEGNGAYYINSPTFLASIPSSFLPQSSNFDGLNHSEAIAGLVAAYVANNPNTQLLFDYHNAAFRCRPAIDIIDPISFFNGTINCYIDKDTVPYVGWYKSPYPYQACELKSGFTDAIYNQSKKGRNPNGWHTTPTGAPNKANPYIVTFDNTGAKGNMIGATSSVNALGQSIICLPPHTARDRMNWNVNYSPWDYDEIAWYGLQPEYYRIHWLRYAKQWLSQNDPNGFIAYPGNRHSIGYMNPITELWEFGDGDVWSANAVFYMPSVAEQENIKCLMDGTNSCLGQAVSPFFYNNGYIPNWSTALNGASNICNTIAATMSFSFADCYPGATYNLSISGPSASLISTSIVSNCTNRLVTLTVPTNVVSGKYTLSLLINYDKVNGAAGMNNAQQQVVTKTIHIGSGVPTQPGLIGSQQSNSMCLCNFDVNATSNTATYQWKLDGILKPSVFNVLNGVSEGTWNVEVKGMNACGVSAPRTQIKSCISTNCPVRVSQQEDINSNLSLLEESKIFPNPSNDILSVYVKEFVKNQTFINIIDMNGNKVLSYIADENPYSFDVQQLRSGVYQCKIQCAKEVQSIMFVKIDK